SEDLLLKVDYRSVPNCCVVDVLEGLSHIEGGLKSAQSGYRFCYDHKISSKKYSEYLPRLPPAAMPRGTAGRARGGAEVGAGLPRVGRLEDLAAARLAVVERGLCRQRAGRAIGQRFRAMHFVEMGLVDAGGSATRGPTT